MAVLPDFCSFIRPVRGMKICNTISCYFKVDLWPITHEELISAFISCSFILSSAAGLILEQKQDNYDILLTFTDVSVFFPFLRKSSEESVRERQKVIALANLKEPSLLQFYISREWLNKFNTFTEPGPITNHTFLCQHGGKNTYKHTYSDDFCTCF